MFICMRTTLNIDDGLMRKIKDIAKSSGRTMTQVIEQALRKELAGEAPHPVHFDLQWITVSGRIRPGVDLSDRDSLIEVMEQGS